jgi:nitrogenase-associated protein
MAVVHFYEKPGCLGNKRQREMLLAAGHIVFVYDLLQQPWSEEKGKLRSFFGELPVADWFNRNAPAVKNGKVVPESVDEARAIELMIADPVLIRRPLLEVDRKRYAGFEAEFVKMSLLFDTDKTLPESCLKIKPDYLAADSS